MGGRVRGGHLDGEGCLNLVLRRRGFDARESTSLTWSTGFGRFRYFDKVPRADVIDIAVNRNVLCDERMFANTPNVLNDA